MTPATPDLVRGLALAYQQSEAAKKLPLRTQAILAIAVSQASPANLAHDVMEGLWAVRGQLDDAARVLCASCANVLWTAAAFAKGDRAFLIVTALRHDAGDPVAYDAAKDPAPEPDFTPPAEEASDDKPG